MTKEQLIEAVLENPQPACQYGDLRCHGGYGAGEGRIEWMGDRWNFYPFQANGRSFEPTDKFVKEVIGEHWRSLIKLYK